MGRRIGNGNRWCHVSMLETADALGYRVSHLILKWLPRVPGRSFDVGLKDVSMPSESSNHHINEVAAMMYVEATVNGYPQLLEKVTVPAFGCSPKFVCAIWQCTAFPIVLARIIACRLGHRPFRNRNSHSCRILSFEVDTFSNSHKARRTADLRGELFCPPGRTFGFRSLHCLALYPMVLASPTLCILLHSVRICHLQLSWYSLVKSRVDDPSYSLWLGLVYRLARGHDHIGYWSAFDPWYRSIFGWVIPILVLVLRLLTSSGLSRDIGHT